MKRGLFISSLVTLLFTVVLLFTACGDDDDADYTIRLNRSSILISSMGASESIEIKASDYWEVRDMPDWLSVTPNHGENIGQIVIIATKNDETDTRKGTITFVCGDASQTLEIEQLSRKDEGQVLTLSEKILNVEITSNTKNVKVITADDWKLESLPSWVHSNIMSGTASTEIRLTFDENIEPIGRRTELTFTSGNTTVTLPVTQYGLAEILRMPTLPIFGYEQVQITDNQTVFNMRMNSMFVNPSIKSKVYLGNLVCPIWEAVTTIPTFGGYTYNPITVSTSAVIKGDISKTCVPSLFNQNAFADYVIEKKPQQGESFKADNGTTEFYSHKQLYTIGMINMGIKLDELISGSSYKNADMPKKYGLIFSFKSTSFSLAMDYPEKLIKEDLEAADEAKSVSYISQVSYGRLGLLVVESDTYFQKVRAAINKVIANKSLTSEESNFIATADISYVYFNNNKEPQMVKGNMEAIKAYKKSMSGVITENIYPLDFTIANYSTHALSSISLTTKVPTNTK